MKDPTLRMTRRLPDGREIETEAEQRGSRIRLRGRLCRDGLVTAAFRVTGLITDLLTKREFLPKEFANDPAITQATFEPIEELWRHRLRLMRRGYWSHSASGRLSPDHPCWDDQVATPPVHSSDP